MGVEAKIRIKRLLDIGRLAAHIQQHPVWMSSDHV
jgi:hypothetical protein